MIVWSVEGRLGRSSDVRRRWFMSEKEADDFIHSLSDGWRSMTGPIKHRIEGRRGLISFLTEYAG